MNLNLLQLIQKLTTNALHKITRQFAISDVSCFSNLYSQRTNIQTKVISTRSFCRKQIKPRMITIENQVTNVEKELKELQNSCANVNISNREIKKENCGEEYFSHFIKVAERINQAARLIEENAGAICQEEPEVLDVHERIKILLKNAREIKYILTQQGIAQLELQPIGRVVDSLSYLINVVEDTLEIENINDFVRESRNTPISQDEEQFLEDIFKETKDIHSYKNL